MPTSVQSTPPEGGYVRCGTVARLLGVSRQTVSEWCRSGALRGAIRTPGGHWRIPRAELDRLCTPRAA